MIPPVASFRLSAATAIHRGDRHYQQDRVAIYRHHQVAACMLAIVADGMGGKSGGRKAADQVLLTGRQVFDRYSPSEDDPGAMLRQLVLEAHLMIKLTAISAEEEPHSTVATFVINPTLECGIAHAGDSRVYHFRDNALLARTKDHSFVQRLVDEGTITPAEALTHPQANLLTGCLGTEQEPTVSMAHIESLQPGDTLLACSDGLWHYFSDKELAAIVHALSPREASEMMVTKARQRARGGGDNLSLAIVRVEEL